MDAVVASDVNVGTATDLRGVVQEKERASDGQSAKATVLGDKTAFEQPGLHIVVRVQPESRCHPGQRLSSIAESEGGRRGLEALEGACGKEVDQVSPQERRVARAAPHPDAAVGHLGEALPSTINCHGQHDLVADGQVVDLVLSRIDYLADRLVDAPGKLAGLVDADDRAVRIDAQEDDAAISVGEGDYRLLEPARAEAAFELNMVAFSGIRLGELSAVIDSWG